MTKNRQKFPPFDDFLDLAENNFHSANLLIFHGISGSGKSSYLLYLTHRHPAFKGKSSHWIWTRHRRFNPCGIQGKDLVVVDEIVSPLQIPAVRSLLRTNQKVAVASHLHPLWFKIFCPSIPRQSFKTDSSTDKLSSHLNRLGIPHSQSSLEAFSRKYGSNFVDLHCVLESAPRQSFDCALKFNEKFNKISVEKQKNWTPVLPRFDFDGS